MSDPKVLLICNDDDRAVAIERLLPAVEGNPELTRAASVALGIEALATTQFDVVLLVPGAPDVDEIGNVHRHATDSPIVVIAESGAASDAIGAGAHDVIEAGALSAVSLRRSVTYALARYRQAELSELKSTLERYRGIVGGTEPEPDRAPVDSDGTLRRRHPEVIHKIDDDYAALTVAYLQHLRNGRDRPSEQLDSMVESLVALEAGPRDVLGVHVRALEKAVHGVRPEMARAVAVAARGLSLDVMSSVTTRYRARALASITRE